LAGRETTLSISSPVEGEGKIAKKEIDQSFPKIR
jgi:hypothetical protein